MDDFWVLDLVEYGLVVEKIEHVLNGKRKNTATERRAEDALEEIVHVRL